MRKRSKVFSLGSDGVKSLCEAGADLEPSCLSLLSTGSTGITGAHHHIQLGNRFLTTNSLLHSGKEETSNKSEATGSGHSDGWTLLSSAYIFQSTLSLVRSQNQE